MGPVFYKVELIGLGFLAVMAKPVAGEWIDEEFSGLSASGIKRVVSLLEASEAYEVGLENEEVLCRKHGIDFASYPMPDRGLPASVGSFGNYTSQLYHDIHGGLNTVIHCRAGIGRTGMLAAGVLLHAAFEVQEAFEHISKARGVEVPDTQEQYKWVEQNAYEITSYT